MATYTFDQYYIPDKCKLIQIFAHVQTRHFDMTLKPCAERNDSAVQDQLEDTRDRSFNKDIDPTTAFYDSPKFKFSHFDIQSSRC
jgi:hypothetical protein